MGKTSIRGYGFPIIAIIATYHLLNDYNQCILKKVIPKALVLRCRIARDGVDYCFYYEHLKFKHKINNWIAFIALIGRAGGF